MKLSMKLSSVACLAIVLCGSGIAAADDAWDHRPTGARDSDGASEWWARTWKTGDHVETTSRYRIHGRLQVRKEDRPALKWYSILAKFIEMDHEVDIQGTARCVNNVLVGGEADANGPVQLVRSFECPISARGASVIGLRNGDDVGRSIAKGYASFYKFMQRPEIQSFARNRIEEGKRLLRAAIQAKLVILTAGASLKAAPATDFVIRTTLDGADAVIADFASHHGESFNKKALERLSMESFDADGGVEMKKNSIFYRELPNGGNDLSNFAMTFNTLFDGKEYYLTAARRGKMLARQLVSEQGDRGESLRVFVEKSQSGSLETLPEAMADVEPSSDEQRVGNVLGRETFNVNAVLFDLRERKIGQTWAASATLLNNFLHPDLKGSFRGIVCMSYDKDEEISLSQPGVADKIFKTRHLRLAERTAGTETNFEYYEPPRRDGSGEFRFRYSPNEDALHAELDVWVDKESGYILKVEANMEGEVQFLPDLLLARGWSFKDGKGKVRLDVASESWPTKLLDTIQ